MEEAFRAGSSLSARSTEEIDLNLMIMRTLPLKVRRSMTIKHLKELVHEKEGICENIQNLFFNGHLLVDGLSLVDYDIPRNSTVHLIVNDCVLMRIFVQIPANQKTIMIEAVKHDTVQDIKSMIQAKEGIQSDEFSLVYNGNLLEDDKSLAFFNIRSESTIQLVFSPKEVVLILVKTPQGEIFKLSVKVMFTVSDIEAIIQNMTGALVWDYSLFYAGKQLDRFKTLAFYEIKDETLLDLLPNTFQVFVKTWVGKTLLLNVQRQDTVADIKSKVFQKLKIPVDIQNIVYAGKRLEDSRDLASYNIQKNSTLNMVLAASFKFNVMSLSDLDRDLSSNLTIGNLKTMIQKKLKSPVKELLFKEVALCDERTLGYYGIQNDATVTAIV